MFETGEEQQEAAAMFSNRLKGLKSAQDREKALRDILISIRRSAAARERKMIENSGQEPSPEMLRKLIDDKRELQELQNIRFRLPDAEGGQ